MKGLFAAAWEDTEDENIKRILCKTHLARFHNLLGRHNCLMKWWKAPLLQGARVSECYSCPPSRHPAVRMTSMTFDWHSVTLSEFEPVNAPSQRWHNCLTIPLGLIYSLVLSTFYASCGLFWQQSTAPFKPNPTWGPFTGILRILLSVQSPTFLNPPLNDLWNLWLVHITSGEVFSSL